MGGDICELGQFLIGALKRISPRIKFLLAQINLLYHGIEGARQFAGLVSAGHHASQIDVATATGDAVRHVCYFAERPDEEPP